MKFCEAWLIYQNEAAAVSAFRFRYPNPKLDDIEAAYTHVIAEINLI
jgi:hypothetical protein